MSPTFASSGKSQKLDINGQSLFQKSLVLKELLEEREIALFPGLTIEGRQQVQEANKLNPDDESLSMYGLTGNNTNVILLVAGPDKSRPDYVRDVLRYKAFLEKSLEKLEGELRYCQHRHKDSSDPLTTETSSLSD